MVFVYIFDKSLVITFYIGNYKHDINICLMDYVIVIIDCF